MSQPVYFVNNNLADSFIQELFIGFDWIPLPEENVDNNTPEVKLDSACYGNINHSFKICFSINDKNIDTDTFVYEHDYNNETPPNPIRMEGQDKYKGVYCYAVVNWDAISDPSLAENDGFVHFDETIINEAATNLDNSPTIKQYIYEHALDNLSGEAVAHNKFLRECVNLPNMPKVTVSVSNSQDLKNAILHNNNVIINLSCDIAIEKDENINNNGLSSEIGNSNSIEHVNTLINFRGKNLIINGNEHKVYEKVIFLQVTLSQDGSRYEAPFSGNLEGNDAFITANGTIIPLTKSKMYQGRGWQAIGYESADDDDEIYVGIKLPEITTNNNYELHHLYDYGECNNLFVSYRLSYLRYTKRVEYISNGYLFFKVKKIDYDDNEAIRDISSHPDFFLINYSGDTDDVGALVKGGYVSYPSFYGNQVSKCWASYLFRVKENSNIVFNKVTFIGGLDYSVRNDGTLHLNKCHFTNQVGGGVVNFRRMLVDRCTFTDIFSYGVRFEHVVGISSPYPYLEVTNSTFKNIAHYGTNTSAIRSIGMAYIAGNEFINTNYSAIYTGQANCSSLDELHSHNLIERNFIHYTPEWIEKRKTFGLQDSGDIYVSVNNIMTVVRLNTIVGTGGIGGTSKYRKNNAIYVDDGAYNVKVYGNVISGTENYYDIDCRDVSNNTGYSRLTPNNHDANDVVLNSEHQNNDDPNRAYIDLSKNNLIAFNVCDGLVRMQENLTLNETGCRFFNNFILGNFRSIQPDIKTNIYNRVDNCLHSEGITPDDYGMNSCASLWYLMYLNKKKSL